MVVPRWGRLVETGDRYKAVYPAETIEAHRAVMGRRRAFRPSEEYRIPTEEEWDAFLAHFEKRKVSIGTCARAFGSPCIKSPSEHDQVLPGLQVPSSTCRREGLDLRSAP